uniref:Uncharacterized protein n=2 Tax=unclassified Caudoviricetes TaxID=2788787 RepID=A0AAU8HYI3_9CAUD
MAKRVVSQESIAKRLATIAAKSDADKAITSAKLAEAGKKNKGKKRGPMSEAQKQAIRDGIAARKK